MKGSKKKINSEQERRIREMQKAFPNDYYKMLEAELGIRAKVIKLHYDNYLRPGLNPEFTEEEDIMLISLVKKMKEQDVNRPFMHLSKIWPNRSPEILKGRWHTLLRRIKYHHIMPDGSRCGYPDIRRVKNRKEGQQQKENNDLAGISEVFTNNNNINLFDMFDETLEPASY